MSKVYIHPQKIFKYFGVLALIFGVVSCASSQSTAAVSGETDGVYYSPSQDGKVQQAQVDKNSYDIEVGSPYFDAEGNGAEDFYYDEQTAQSAESNDVHVYTGSNNIYLGSSGATDWGRYDGIDITVNNYGWNNPWWGFGYNSWSWGWGYPRWGWYNSWYFGGHYGYHPYWGGYYGYNPYWGGYYGYNPYWGGGYYSYHGYGHHGYPNYYYRGSTVRPGVRPGSNLAYGTNYRNSSPFRGGSRLNSATSIRPIRDGNSSVRNNNLRSENAPVRQVRESNVRENSNVRTSATPVRDNNNIRVDQNNNVRPVRTAAPDNVRPNTPIRTNNNIRTNSNIRQNSNIRTNSNNNLNIRSSQPRNNSNMRSSSGSNMRSSSSNSGMRSSGTSGSTRSGGSRR